MAIIYLVSFSFEFNHRLDETDQQDIRTLGILKTVFLTVSVAGWMASRYSAFLTLYYAAPKKLSVLRWFVIWIMVGELLFAMPRWWIECTSATKNWLPYFHDEPCHTRKLDKLRYFNVISEFFQHALFDLVIWIVTILRVWPCHVWKRERRGPVLTSVQFLW